MDDDLIRTMYEVSDEEEEEQEQPIQLRLAGKATVVNMGGRQLPVPRMEYIEALEARLTALERVIEEQNTLLKRYGKKLSASANVKPSRGQPDPMPFRRLR